MFPLAVMLLTLISLPVEFENADGEDEDGGKSNDSAFDNWYDTWEGKNFVETKKTIRKLFSGFYLSDDFESENIDFFSLKDLLKLLGGMWSSGFKKAASLLSFWWRSSMVQNPYNADGEECGSEYDKLF